MASHIVTRDSLHMLVTRGDHIAMHAIGRALLHLFNRQTQIEQSRNETNIHNTVGFTGSDARRGCITAKYYLKHRRLEAWQIEQWARPSANGYARIAKYWRQLDEEAQKKKVA